MGANESVLVLRSVKKDAKEKTSDAASEQAGGRACWANVASNIRIESWAVCVCVCVCHQSSYTQ